MDCGGRVSEVDRGGRYGEVDRGGRVDEIDRGGHVDEVHRGGRVGEVDRAGCVDEVDRKKSLLSFLVAPHSRLISNLKPLRPQLDPSTIRIMSVSPCFIQLIRQSPIHVIFT